MKTCMRVKFQLVTRISRGTLSDGETLQRYTQNSIIFRSGKILDAKVTCKLIEAEPFHDCYS